MSQRVSWQNLFHLAVKNADRKTKFFLLWGMTGMIVNALSTAFLSKSIRPILDHVFIQGEKKALARACVTILMVFLFKGLSEYINNISIEIAGQRISNSLQKNFFSSVIHAKFHFFQHIHTGDLSSVLINDVRTIRDTIIQTFNNTIQNIFLSIFLFILMIKNNILLTALCAFIVPFISFMIKKVGKKIKDLSHTSSCQNADLKSFFYEVFHNIILVKTSVTQKKEVEKINQKLDRIEKNAWHLAKIRAAAHPIVEILGGLAIVTSIMIGGWQVIHQQKTVGSFFSFIISGLFLYPSLKKLAGVRCKIQEGLSSYQHMSDIAQKANVESDHRIVHSQTNFLTSQGNITIKNLCFRYPGYDAKILDNFHCTLSPGCLTVLTGPSGTGKTTLFYILMRLYDPESGTILWGDQNIKDIPIDRLRQNISFVSQNNHLFDESIFYNIAYGTTASQQCVIQAAEKAFAHEFIKKMPGQYDTMIGQNGIQLSGGQRQRIALARAFLRNTPIILLDESTSALDSNCEKQIIQSIHHLKESGKIVVAIAHRPSIIKQADQILSIHSIDTTQS